MLEFGNVTYYIDLSKLDSIIYVDNNKTNKTIKSIEKKIVKDSSGNLIGSEEVEHIHEKGKEIDPAKYEIIRLMLETVIDFIDEDLDASLGADRALEKTPLPFKMAFNTLYNYGIIKEKE
jgi:hypothetical protein